MARPANPGETEGMTTDSDPYRRRSSLEERANVISHAIGLVLAVIGTVVLIAVPAVRGLPWRSVTCGVFGVTAIATFLSSVVYHATQSETRRQRWLEFDYAAIYLLIAGTYTPLAIHLLPPWVGGALFAVEWLLAAGGMALVLQGREPSTLFYIVLGAGGLFVAPALIAGIPTGGLVLLGLGGLAYVGGAGFYVAHRLPFNHLIWHICVILGVGFHYAAILRYVALG